MIQNIKSKIRNIFPHHSKVIPKRKPIAEEVMARNAPARKPCLFKAGNEQAKHASSSHGEQIMVNCLKVDASLKTLYKALEYDEDNVHGFTNDYMYILEDAIKVNWNNHNVGEDVSRDEFHRLLNNKK